MIHLSGKNRALNEVTVKRVGEKEEDTLIMIHGYGAGLGFFYKNFKPISRIKGLKLYALDILGCGNSSQPAFKIHAKKKEDQARKLEQFTLLGHSLGGYLAVSYAIKYPGRLKKLILASPVGIPSDPYAINASIPEPNTSTIQNEITQDQQSTTDQNALHDYSFSIFKQKGNSKYTLAYILAPGAYTRRPVIDRIQEVGHQTITKPDRTTVKETGSLASEEKLKETRQKVLENATEDEKKRENGNAKVLLVPKAGHHLYLNNPEVFNDMIRKELEDTQKSKQRKQ
ncbi:hypothetical protein BFJ66_g979 [Fusarium oxysporum f. sp. cepae]|nr:hypothetical protein BFJ67_g16023 [Fusarium oxysporum f. sp. cepae]RKK62171.1 hypothetical protein BFJ66_g979 [Fusarium oxysporum f. sp. cepae]